MNAGARRIVALGVGACACLWAAAVPARGQAADAQRQVNALVLYGAHPSGEAALLQCLRGMDELTCDVRPSRRGARLDVFDSPPAKPWDVIVLYTMEQELSPAGQAGLLKLLGGGAGLVVLHHAIAAFPDWAEFDRIIGARYRLKPERKGGVVYPLSTSYQIGAAMKIHVADATHPVTEGLSDFTVSDEAYGMFSYYTDNHLLLSSSTPPGSKYIAWTWAYRNARVIYLEPGHGPGVFADATYRELLARAIRWAAGPAADKIAQPAPVATPAEPASQPATSQPAAWAAAPDQAADQAAEKLFESLYGKAVARVGATSDRADDAALAGELLAAARIAQAQPALVELLCEKACDLAERAPEGYPTAVAAMRLLADLARGLPAKADACWTRILAIRTRQLNAASPPERLAAGQAAIEALLELVGSKVRQGDGKEALALARRAHAVAETVGSPAQEEIAAGVRYLLARGKVEAELKSLQAALTSDANDQKARDRLIDLLVMELDAPGAAVALLNAGCRQDVRTYVPLAAKDVGQLPAEVCLELGDWFRELADKAGPCGKGLLLRHARDCYERYLAAHEQQDVSRLKATLGLKRTEEAMKNSPPPPPAFTGAGGPPIAAAAPLPAAPPPAEEKWRDLFNGKDLTGWTGDTTAFRVQGGTIIGGSPKAPVPRSVFLCTAEQFGDFELTAKVRLAGGTGTNGGIQFRSRNAAGGVSGYQADMGLGPGQVVWGSLWDEGRRQITLAKADPKLVARALKPNGWNEYRIRCEGPRVRIWLNDVLTVDYTETNSSIDRTGVIGIQIKRGPPGEAAYRDLRIRPLK